jgi:hypothetical protein
LKILKTIQNITTLRNLLEEFFKKRVKKIKFEKVCRFENFRKMGASRPINGREAWGRRPPAHPAGRRSQNFSQAPPEGLFANKKLFLFAKRPLTRPRRHPARPTGGRIPEGHPACPTGGTFNNHYISPHLPPNSHIIQQKSGKKEREQRKRRSPVHTSVWRYILVLVV